MEWKSNLRRTQSLRSVPSSSDKPVWAEAGLKDRKASVSQLVARYQAKVEVTTSTDVFSINHVESKQQEITLQPITTIQPPHESAQLERNSESKLESFLRRNDERERSQTRTNLTRSKSMGSLQTCTTTIVTLRALFESKASAPHNVKGSFRAASHTPPAKAAEIMPAVKGEAEGRKSPEDEQKTLIPAKALGNDAKADAKEEVALKVVNQTRIQRRRTIAGIDFEKIAASQADFRDSSFIQAREKLPVSVKTISALYLSKLAPAEPTGGLLKAAQDQSSESGKTVKRKMAEESQQKKDDPLLPHSARHQPGSVDMSGAHAQSSMSSQPSKEKLYQQRQKCELRRLLKHTHPEVKMLDEIVDEELAEVLSSESGLTAAETGYEGEVLSRRWMFENRALSNKVEPQTPKKHLVERGDRRSASFEQPWERLHEESTEGIMESPKMQNFNLDPNECEEKMVRIDVQSTRRIFESQSVETAKSNPDSELQGKVVISEDETGAVQKRKQEFEMCCKEKVQSENKSSTGLDLTKTSHEQGPCVNVSDPRSEHNFSENHQDINEASTGEPVFENQSMNLPNSEGFQEISKTSAALFQNNPFISANIEREQSHVQRIKAHTLPCGDPAAEDILPANVKNRAQMFESMPFDKIRHQNKDEKETMVENISETLNSLYHFSVIHSDGSIIEVNETMIAKKAKYTLSESGPKIKYDEVAEGGAQNFILQLLPRTNLKPFVIYLKEDSQGNVEATTVKVPVHQHHFTSNQDTEFKTANVAQIVEDILNQDNSLRRGVIIQEDANGCVEVIVYSLYNYAEGDIKSYCSPQECGVEPEEPESEIGHVNETESQEPIKGDVKSTISCLLATTQDPTCPGSIRPEVTVKGNVKLFRSCIEKGDLEYLKTLQAQPIVQEQEVSPDITQTAGGSSMETHKQGDQQAEENTTEWAPVDMKRLRNIFSADQSQVQPKQTSHDDLVHSAKISPGFTCQNVPLGRSGFSLECDEKVFSHDQVKNKFRQSGSQVQEKACDFEVVPQGSRPYLEIQDDGMVHQAELVEVIDDEDEISNLEAAIHSLQQATMEAKALDQASQEKQQSRNQGLSTEHMTGSENVKNPKAEGLPQELACGKPELKAPTSASCMTPEHKSEKQHEKTETYCSVSDSEKQTIEAYGAEGQQGTEVVQKHTATMMSSQGSATKPQQEDKEDDVPGNLQAALKSLERSNINVTRGDFHAAMIYRNSSKSHKERSKIADSVPAQNPTEEECSVTESKSTPCVTLRQEEQVATEELSTANVEPPSPSQTPSKLATSTSSKKRRRPVGPKPAIPPKPENLKVKHTNNQPTIKNIEATQNNTMTTEMKTQLKKENAPQPSPTTSMTNKELHMKGLSKTDSTADSRPKPLDPEQQETNELVGKAFLMSQTIQVNYQAHGSKVTEKEGGETRDISVLTVNENIVNKPEDVNATAKEKCPQSNVVKMNENEPDESHVDFHEACKKFGGKKVVSGRGAPINPKKVRIAQNDIKNLKPTSGDKHSTILTHVDAEPQQILADPLCNNPNPKNKHESDMQQESKVVLREKKGNTETEDERRQRLSVHMDEIMRGNITAVMEIFDNLRKQEELQNILTRVEEIEQDTSMVDVKSLRKVYEDVPAWVVNPQETKQEQAKVEHRVEKVPSNKDSPESMSSMAHVFGDLERASEEIMNLKEQTLTRLMDIEQAIKKALYSVSTLKSDSDIAGLSGLFKESLGTVQGSPPSGNVRKISIGSSRSKTTQAQGSPTKQQAVSLPVGPCAGFEAPSRKPQAGPPSSPAFISIQSAARKKDKTQVLPPDTTTCLTCQRSPKAEEKFRTTKTLRCNSAAQNKKEPSHYPDSPLNSKCELSVLEVQTDPEGNSIMGTRTVTENYERADNFGNRFYSTKTSTVVTTQPETMASSGGLVVTSPTTYQVTTYPEVRLPINQKP